MTLVKACPKQNRSLFCFTKELLRRGYSRQFLQLTAQDNAARSMTSMEQQPKTEKTSVAFNTKDQSNKENFLPVTLQPAKSKPEEICTALSCKENCLVWSISPEAEDNRLLAALLRYLNHYRCLTFGLFIFLIPNKPRACWVARASDTL